MVEGTIVVLIWKNPLIVFFFGQNKPNMVTQQEYNNTELTKTEADTLLEALKTDSNSISEVKQEKLSRKKVYRITCQIGNEIKTKRILHETLKKWKEFSKQVKKIFKNQQAPSTEQETGELNVITTVTSSQSQLHPLQNDQNSDATPLEIVTQSLPFLMQPPQASNDVMQERITKLETELKSLTLNLETAREESSQSLKKYINEHYQTSDGNQDEEFFWIEFPSDIDEADYVDFYKNSFFDAETNLFRAFSAKPKGHSDASSESADSSTKKRKRSSKGKRPGIQRPSLQFSVKNYLNSLNLTDDKAKFSLSDKRIKRALVAWFCEYHKLYCTDVLHVNDIVEFNASKLANDFLMSMVTNIYRNHKDSKTKNSKKYKSVITSYLAKKRRIEKQTDSQQGDAHDDESDE